jgi:hypothetical protein
MKCDQRLLQAAVAGQEAIRKLNAGDMQAAITQMAIMLMSVRQFEVSRAAAGMFSGGPVGAGKAYIVGENGSERFHIDEGATA